MKIEKVNKRPASNKRPLHHPTPQKYFLSSQPRISAHPPPLQKPRKKEKNNNKVHKRNTGIDYYSISLMAFNLNML